MSSRFLPDGDLANNLNQKRNRRKKIISNKISVMKNIVLTVVLLYAALNLNAQQYPEPEFTNEVYYLKKDSIHSLMRLEKEISKMDTKTKAAGFGGFESGYVINGEKSSARLMKGTNLSFVLSTGSSTKSSSAQTDSIMRANGMDPSMLQGMSGGMGDPANGITLYKTVGGKGQRKILMQKGGGAFGSKKLQSSDKYTFSVRKIREGYWELVIDKTLPKGEYAFTTMAYTGTGNMD
jgi:hypothetical protein